MTASRNDVASRMKLDECGENEHRWWSAAILENNCKTLSSITARRIIDESTASVNYSKSQCERKRGKVKCAKEIRE